jgi:16S rRNA processing protein RimM
MASSARLVLLGVFGAAQGVRGEVRVKSFTAEPKAIAGYGDLTDGSGARAFRFVAARPLRDDMLVVRLAGVTTRDAAQALTGVEIFARRDQLPPPAADEFYYDDLVGLAAVTSEGAPLGRVLGLRNYGAGDILEIAPADGGETLLMPFNKAVATAIDFAGARIVVDPPREIDGEAPPPAPQKNLRT